MNSLIQEAYSEDIPRFGYEGLKEQVINYLDTRPGSRIVIGGCIREVSEDGQEPDYNGWRIIYSIFALSQQLKALIDSEAENETIITFGGVNNRHPLTISEIYSRSLNNLLHNTTTYFQIFAEGSGFHNRNSDPHSPSYNRWKTALGANDLAGELRYIMKYTKPGGEHKYSTDPRQKGSLSIMVVDEPEMQRLAVLALAHGHNVMNSKSKIEFDDNKRNIILIGPDEILNSASNNHQEIIDQKFPGLTAEQKNEAIERFRRSEKWKLDFMERTHDHKGKYITFAAICMSVILPGIKEAFTALINGDRGLRKSKRNNSGDS